ncbi:glycosyltransferase involved in cell wall biosynthesis [Maribacter vaceletii]|uniref:Glycosyltransferase involved in cell wall biosynthesis n=1 Tax=Maribacter vaceletii TaxID=1206816 RepID=A0A495DTF2_9FLAO|nr:glycosyltransferase family 4 protein [Maribacter vaceletii]RKR07182.1 glycosyltransferase involved in cell wall biosynthesis [Maribacter vaceletii]
MKIIYLHQYFSTPKVSGGTRSYDLAKKYIEQGHEVEFITSSIGFKETFEKKWTFLEIENITFHVLNTPSADNAAPYIKRIIVFLQFLWSASFKILKLKGDIVISTSTPLTIGIPALIKKWIHKTPYIFEVRDVWPEAVIAIGAIKNKIAQHFLYLLEAKIYNNASAIVPLSIDMKNSITTRFPHLRCPIITIENISELTRFKEGYHTDISVIKENIGFVPRFSILYAGTFGKVNGLSYVINIAEKIIQKDPSIVFILLGRGSEKEALIKKATEKNVLNKNVFILKSVPKSSLPQWYYECQMGSSFVIPIKELWANSANKFFDSLAAGRPVLINHKGWQEEVLTKKESGYILPYNLEDINDTNIDKFIAFTNNKEYQHHQKENAIKLAELFSLQNASSKYLSILQNIKLT